MQVEFAVQMTCSTCVEKIKSALEGVPGINEVDVKLQEGSVVVETTLSSEDVRQRLENTGRKAIVKGLAGEYIHSFIGIYSRTYLSRISIIH